jgi:hypothetical protein
MLKKIAVALPLLAVSSLAFAGTNTLMCGKYPISATQQCCYANQAYSRGASIQTKSGKQWCHSGGSAAHPDAYWSGSAQPPVL